MVFFNQNLVLPFCQPDDLLSAQVTIAAAPLQVESGEELRPVMLQVGPPGGLTSDVGPGDGEFWCFFSTKKRRPQNTNSIPPIQNTSFVMSVDFGLKKPMGFGISFLGNRKVCFFSDVFMFVSQRCHV